MNDLYAELRWLPRAPADFSARLAAIAAADAPCGAALRSLAGHALDLPQLIKLAREIARARACSGALDTLVPLRLAVLGNSTLDLVVPALVASAARHGIALEVVLPPYDQVAQQALSADSLVNTSKPDAVLLAIDHRALPLKPCPGNRPAAQAALQGSLAYLRALRDGIRSNSSAVCILQTFAPPPETLFGNLDRGLPGTQRQLLTALNEEVAAGVLESGDALLDVATIAETVGLAAWHDAQQWNLGKFAFAEAFLPLYAEHAARTLAALRGKSRKALVLDLDNTLWGGVVGDEGLEAIRIAQGDAEGEAHLALQRLALQLRERGIVLAVCSKNHDEVARTPFERHPEMLLRLEHIAVFQANWDDKATNIRAIARELSLGLDALVFLDDNPAERELVRRLLPQVAVPELPDDPADYARTLAAAGYFETVSFTAEDSQRAAAYRDNARRASLERQAGGVEAFLASLDMTITFAPFDATGRPRIVQLINKSNQYNLTTRRYTDAEVMRAEQDEQVFTLQVRLADMFGDNGMISVVICRPVEPRTWEIDTWLMSCRVLGRRVEHMVLAEILKRAREAGIERLIGVYRPTERNHLVVDHYEKLGFTRISEEESATRWQLRVDGASPQSAPMKVVCRGFAQPAEAID